MLGIENGFFFGRAVNVFKAELSLQPLHQNLLVSKLLLGPLILEQSELSEHWSNVAE